MGGKNSKNANKQQVSDYRYDAKRKKKNFCMYTPQLHGLRSSIRAAIPRAVHENGLTQAADAGGFE